MRNSVTNRLRIIRLSVVGCALTAAISVPLPTPFAQQQKSAPNVTGISTRKTPKGQVISINTDGPVSGTQTWQDPNGKFNLVLPGSGQSQVKSSNGVEVRQIGNSLGIGVPTKPGSNVTVQPRANGVDLIIEGEVDSSRSASQENAQAAAARQANKTATSPATTSGTAPAEAQPVVTSSASTTSAGSESLATSVPSSSQPSTSSSQSAPVAASTSANQPAPNQAPTAPVNAEANDDGGILSYIFSYTGLGVLLLLGLVLVFVLRRREEGGWEHVEEEATDKAHAQPEQVDLMAEETARTGERRKRDRRKPSEAGGRRATDQTASLVKAPAAAAVVQKGDEPVMEVRPNGLVTTALFGAYRVDQEVGKLVLGQAHRMDVLASRAPDDRRAIEASLLKALSSSEMDEDGRRRARLALEEYGFVARQSAALLFAQDAYERASAARVLGDVQSSSSLPFLLEALYDQEQIVRTQAVTSIGALKLPSAIGALLDMARRYPDMPQSLLSRALSDCSVECLDITGMLPGRSFLSVDDEGYFTGEITALQPANTFAALPEWLEDESLNEALERLASADVEARTAAAQSLAQYQVQRGVDALTALASSDPEPSVRGAAVTSLGAIDHETVFAPVLLAFVDEAREVRAAAARALSRLNFDRADAYVRLIETSDPETLAAVATACVKAGMAKQAFDRLASDDRRQAYEAFTLLSLLVRAGETAPILEAINEHRDVNVRLAAIKLLGISRRTDVIQQLRELAVADDIPEKVRMALMEVVYRLDQAGDKMDTHAEPVDC